MTLRNLSNGSPTWKPEVTLNWSCAITASTSVYTINKNEPFKHKPRPSDWHYCRYVRRYGEWERHSARTDPVFAPTLLPRRPKSGWNVSRPPPNRFPAQASQNFAAPRRLVNQ